MSEEKISKIREFLAKYPAYKHVPVMVVDNKAITLEEAVSYLERGLYVSQILEGLSKLGLDPEWRLVEEFYRRLATAYPEVKMYALGEYVPAMNLSEAYEHVKKRDETGKFLRDLYSNLLSFMRMEMMK